MNAKSGVQNYVVTLHIDCVPSEVHYFTLPARGDMDFYAAQTSLNCFELRELEYFKGSEFYNPALAPPRYRSRVEHHSSFHSPVASLVRALADIPPLKVFQHSSLWEMYSAIGYDYKKQRYIRDGKNQGTLSALQESNSIGDSSDDGGIPEAAAS